MIDEALTQSHARYHNNFKVYHGFSGWPRALKHTAWWFESDSRVRQIELAAMIFKPVTSPDFQIAAAIWQSIAH
ncbi:MAG TPA: hypothetical protein VE860_14450 [Chthoniobacterales bacterium]|nr:hypothetical protein [Chthoniobacterales bacterium]